MRKITQESISAFLSGTKYNNGNMSVYNHDGYTCLALHGNVIARKHEEHGIEISSAGWKTNTTKERLNGLLFELNLGKISQIKGIWHLDINGTSDIFPSDSFVKIA